jgi:photosystem II stability/assembly factor-like uncharacterized protein
MVLFYSADSYAQLSNSSYLPLAVGNKWQYLQLYDGWQRYQTVSVTKDTVINNINYYYLAGAINNWARYDDSSKQIIIRYQDSDYLNMDMNYNIGTEFNSYVFSFNGESGIKSARVYYDDSSSIFSRQFHSKGIEYSSSGLTYRFIFTEELGITEICNTYNHPGSSKYALVRAAISGNDTVFKYSDGVKPQITIVPLLVTNKYNNIIQASISHPYEGNENTSYDFIDSIKLESYYYDGTNKIHDTTIIGTRDFYSKVCNFNFNLDSALLKLGYDFYYRIYAVDRGVVPEYSSKPDLGFYRLVYSPNSVTLWEKKITGRTDNVTSVGFADNLIGYVTLMNGGDAQTHCTILATTDGGANWNTKYINNLRFPNKVYFINATTGFMLGYGDAEARIIKTTNGGVSWSKIVSMAYSCELYDINFPTPQIGYTNAFGVGSYLYKTTNAGENWVQLYQENFPYSSDKIIFVDSLYGWCNNRTAKTTDGGLTWVAGNSNLSDIFSISFLNKDLGWAIGHVYDPYEHYKIIKTTNGGINWIEQVSPVDSRLNDICFIDSLKGWACGDGGVVIHTVDGGLHWDKDYINTICNLTSIYNHEKQIWICGEQGSLYCQDINKLNEIKDNHSIAISGYSLEPNYPNPFNPETNIRFSIPFGSNVKLTVYNSLGQKVKELVNGYKEIGSYEVRFSGRELASGMYIYKLDAVSKDGKKNFSSSRKMLFVK